MEVIRHISSIEECKDFINIFKGRHDFYKNFVLDKKNNQDYKFQLSFEQKENSDYKDIKLDIVHWHDPTEEGMHTSMDNEGIYRYLLASTLDYYFDQNYKNTHIDLKYNNGYLYSSNPTNKFVPMSLLIEPQIYESYKHIIHALVVFHNNKLSSASLIENLEKDISSKRLIK